MVEITVDHIIDTLGNAIALAQADTSNSDKRSKALERIVEAVRGLGEPGDATLQTTLNREIQQLQALKQVVADASGVRATAHSEITQLQTAVENLVPALTALGDAEDKLVEQVEAFKPSLDDIVERVSGRATELKQELDAPIEAVQHAGIDAEKLVRDLAGEASTSAGAVGDGLAALCQSFERESTATVEQGWNRIILGLGSDFSSNNARNAEQFDRSGQTTQANIFGAADSALGTASDGAARMSEVLRRVADAVEAARALQLALSIASGGL